MEAESNDSKPRICLPGQRICLSDENIIAGHGTYERQGYIYASLMGTINVREKDNVSVIKLYRFQFQLLLLFSPDSSK